MADIYLEPFIIGNELRYWKLNKKIVTSIERDKKLKEIFGELK